MGSLCGSSKQVSTQTSNQNTNQAYTPAGLDALNDIWGRVQSVAAQPYTPYGGQMVAGLTPEQLAGISNINNAYGTAQPYFNEAAGYARTGAAAIDPNDIQRYISPYTQSVIDATRANFGETNAQQQQQVLGNAAMRGALGGDRVAVAQAELARQQKLAQDPVIAGLYNNAYTQALGAAQGDRAAAAQGAYTFGALAPAIQNAQIQGGQAQIGAGTVAQQNEQARLNAAYQQYLQALAFPYQQAGFLASAGLPAISAMGGSTSGTSSGTSTTTRPGPSPLGQIAGLGLTAAGLFTGNPMMAMGGLGGMFGGGGFQGLGGNPNSAMAGYDPSGNFFNYSARGGRINRKHGGRISDFTSTVHEIRQALRRGGPVIETARRADGIYVPRGYADGGEISPFGDRFGAAFDPAYDPGIDPAQLQDSHFGQFGADPAAFAGAPAPTSPYIPIPQPRPQIASSPFALPPQMAVDSPIALPGAAMGYSGETPTGGGLRVQDSPSMVPLGAAPSVGTAPSGGTGPFGLSEEARMGLISAGLGMMASESPFALSQIGQGGLHGIKTYSERKNAKDRIESEARRLAQQASQFAQNLDLGRDRLAESRRYHDILDTTRREAEAGRLMQPVKIGTDKYGTEIYGVREPKSGKYRLIDPTTGQLRDDVAPVDAPQAPLPQVPAAPAPIPGAPVSTLPPGNVAEILSRPDQASRPVRLASTVLPDNFLPIDAKGAPIANPDALLPSEARATQGEAPKGLNPAVLEEFPQMAETIKGMSEGRIQLPPRSFNTPYGKRLLEAVTRYDPTFDQSNVTVRKKLRESYLGGGKASDNIRSFNQVMQHVGEHENAIRKLSKYHSVYAPREVNAAIHAWKSRTDPEYQAALTEYQKSGQAIASELMRSFRGVGSGTLQEIEEWKKGMDPLNSPVSQLAAVQTAIKLLHGAIESQGERWNSSMGPASRRDPLSWLSPKARDSFDRVTAAEPTKAYEDMMAEHNKSAGRGTGVKRPASVPEGSQYSPSRKMWRSPDGLLFDAAGQRVQ